LPARVAGPRRGAAARLHLWNAVGALLGGTGGALLGYDLGQIDVISKNLLVVADLVVLISVLPIAREILKRGRKAGTAPSVRTRCRTCCRRAARAP